MAIVYKITNIKTKKSYIGWTSGTLESRWYQHTWDAFKSTNNRKFHNAIRKYGIESWDLEILCETCSNDDAKLKEIDFILQYDTYYNGYNATKGGDGNNGIIMSKESNEKRSKALKGIPKTYDRMLGKTHSEESKKKISESHKGTKKPWIKWTKEQIEKSALTRRSMTKEQYESMIQLRSEGMSLKQIASKLNVSHHVVKKWIHKTWELS